MCVSSPAEGDATRKPEPVPGSLPGLWDLCSGCGTLSSGKFGRPAGRQQHEAGLDVQVVAAHGPHQGTADTLRGYLCYHQVLLLYVTLDTV